MKKYLLIYTVLIVSLCMNAFAKGPSPETIAKTQEIINAIEKKDLAVFKELIKDPAAINIVVKGTSETHTPLTKAVSYYDIDKTMKVEMVNLLLEAGAKVDFANDSKMTPLMYAASYGHTEIVNILIKAGAKVNLADDRKMSALMMAVQSGHKDIAEILINNKANIKQQSKFGGTPLFYCLDALIAYGKSYLNSECLDLLLANGADPIVEMDSQGESFYSRILHELWNVKDQDKRKFLEKILLTCSSDILKNNPNYITKNKMSMLMMLARRSGYISRETLEQILSEAAKSKADFSLAADKKTAFEHLDDMSIVYTKSKNFADAAEAEERAFVNMKLGIAYELFKAYNAQSGRPYKNAEKVIDEKIKNYKEKQKAFDEKFK